MLKLVVDTSVWLDLARDHRAEPVISALEDLIKAGEVILAMPQIVLDEFERRKDQVAEETRKGLRTHFRLVRDAIRRLADEAEKGGALKALEELDHKIAVTGDVVTPSFGRVTALITSAPVIPTTDAIKMRVTDRALAGYAPYHRTKNSVGDAILIETFADVLASLGADDAAAFVSHNVKDFSAPDGDRRLPHPDLAPLFPEGRSSYWTSLVDCLKDLDPELVDEHDFELNFAVEPRRLSEIMEAEHLLFRQVWYNRHWNLRTEIENGTHFVVPEAQYSRNPYRNDQTLEGVWASALAAAKRTEDEVGVENLGPWDDFEWGMLNGKLSALRWVLGDDWDMLDT
ncbi:PIN domain-containing protein [Rhizobium puerariae]|uniref:PIN domain-containing protein n=1 Tax=Rhizobium puerariae TaxID=1585791 RepID=A0ABV6ATH0_9HYPH